MVALIFVRETSDPLTSLVKKIDQKVTEAAGKVPGTAKPDAYVIFADAPGLADKLRGLAKKESLKRVALSIAVVPPRYAVNKEAEVTVVIYNLGPAGRKTVQANFALRKGELDDKKSAAILEALSKALPK